MNDNRPVTRSIIPNFVDVLHAKNCINFFVELLDRGIQMIVPECGSFFFV